MPYFGIGAKETFSAWFFFTGYCYKISVSNIHIHKRRVIVPIGIVLVTFGVHFYQATLLSFLWWQVLPYGITAVIAVLAVFHLCKRIAQEDNFVKRSLTFIGNNTLTILTWHFLCFKIVSLVIIICYKLPVQRLAEFPVIGGYSEQGWFILYFLFGGSLPLLMTRSKLLK